MTDGAHRRETGTAKPSDARDDDELFDRAPEDVPDQGALERVARMALVVQSLVLLVVGIAGVVLAGGDGFFGRDSATFLALRLNLAHSVLLLVTAVVVGGAAFASRVVLRRVMVVQTVGYLLLGLYGVAFAPTPLDLNGPDLALHGVLFILGFSSAYVLAARILEPGEPAPPPTQPRPGRDGG